MQKKYAVQSVIKAYIVYTLQNNAKYLYLNTYQ